MQNILLEPYSLNAFFTLKNKIVMAPMTRAKASDELVPHQAMADYYAKRADAGLIVTEATVISPDAVGYANVPGIFTQAQINGWKPITQAVHEKNGLIFLQLWHVGRVSHPYFLNGALPIAPSETMMTSRVYRSHGLTYGASRAATIGEIKKIIMQFADASENAISAGFDGIEIHGANGYLIDQFLHYHTNHREDDYGGAVENRARFALEVVKAVGEKIGYERVGLRLSPGGYMNEIVSDVKDALVFQYLLEQLNALPLAYLHTGNFEDTKIYPELLGLTMTAFMRAYYKRTLIASGSYTIESATAGILQKAFDLVSIGRSFIANPDLIDRIHQQKELKSYHVDMLNDLR